jgi:hypothetical protein
VNLDDFSGFSHEEITGLYAKNRDPVRNSFRSPVFIRLPVLPELICLRIKLGTGQIPLRDFSIDGPKNRSEAPRTRLAKSAR